MESVWSVSKLWTESVGSRRELVSNCVYTPPTRRNSTVLSRQRRQCVLGIKYCNCTDLRHDTSVHSLTCLAVELFVLLALAVWLCRLSSC